MKAKLITTALVANVLIAAWTPHPQADGSGGSDGGAMDGGRQYVSWLHHTDF